MTFDERVEKRHAELLEKLEAQHQERMRKFEEVVEAIRLPERRTAAIELRLEKIEAAQRGRR